MAKLKVGVRGTSKIGQKLKQLGDAINSYLEQAVLAGAEVIADEMSSRAPRRYGELAASITVEMRQKTDKSAVAAIGPSKETAWYAKFIEFGTKGPYKIKFKKSNRIIEHPGIAANPFVFPSLEAAKKPARARVRRELRNAVKRVAT